MDAPDTAAPEVANARFGNVFTNQLKSSGDFQFLLHTHVAAKLN